MDQKRETSLPVGYKTAKPKQETGNDCDVISGHPSFAGNKVLTVFFICVDENSLTKLAKA